MTGGLAFGIPAMCSFALEALLLSFWVPWFYRQGVRLLQTSVRLPPGFAPSEEQLELAASGGVVTPRLAFHWISDREIGFQEALGTNLWSPYP